MKSLWVITLDLRWQTCATSSTGLDRSVSFSSLALFFLTWRSSQSGFFWLPVGYQPLLHSRCEWLERLSFTPHTIKPVGNWMGWYDFPSKPAKSKALLWAPADDLVLSVLYIPSQWQTRRMFFPYQNDGVDELLATRLRNWRIPKNCDKNVSRPAVWELEHGACVELFNEPGDKRESWNAWHQDAMSLTVNGGSSIDLRLKNAARRGKRTVWYLIYRRKGRCRTAVVLF